MIMLFNFYIKNMKKTPENSATSTSVLGLNLSPETRKFITWVWLSVWLLIGWNGGFKNEAQAQMWISPTPMNIMTSPLYSSLPWNIWHSDDKSKYEKWFKELEEKSLDILVKNNTWIQEQDLKKINTLFIEHLAKIYNSKEQKSGLLSMWELLEIGQKAGITEIQTLQIVKIYVKNNLIPENISRDVLYSVISFYNQETFLLKMTQVEILHKEWKEISQESIYPIFKEYFDAKFDKESDQKKIALAIILWAFLLAGCIAWWKWYLMRNDK